MATSSSMGERRRPVLCASASPPILRLTVRALGCLLLGFDLLVNRIVHKTCDPFPVDAPSVMVGVRSDWGTGKDNDNAESTRGEKGRHHGSVHPEEPDGSQTENTELPEVSQLSPQRNSRARNSADDRCTRSS